ncbi:MAG: methylation-associated defense system AAA family ATPase MAD3 [Anaerolineae bacterium]
MLRRVEAWHYKCLKQVSVELHPVNILIGPNASGKSTLLDVLSFLRDALEGDVEEAVRRRAVSLRELVWNQADETRGFEVAIEVDVPHHLRTTNDYDRLRYEIGVGRRDEEGDIVVSGENLWLVNPRQRLLLPTSPQLPLPFPRELDDSKSVLHPARSKTPPGYRVVVRKVSPGGNDYFRSERTGWNITFRLSPRRLALSGVPEDLERFPIALWLRDFLRRNVRLLQLNSVLMRRPCPSDAPRSFQPDGSNLPLMVSELRMESPQRFQWWIGHLQTILEDLEDVTVAERKEDLSRYLVVTYRNGLRVPAWMLSDGTLRVLALTLIAYLPHQDRLFLIEEPENGVHPRAVEAVYRPLTSVYEGQVFLATHSPLFMALAEPAHLLIFGKTPGGATDVVRGPDHPALREWRSEVPLDTLFAAGVLG